MLRHKATGGVGGGKAGRAAGSFTSAVGSSGLQHGGRCGVLRWVAGDRSSQATAARLLRKEAAAYARQVGDFLLALTDAELGGGQGTKCAERGAQGGVM